MPEEIIEIEKKNESADESFSSKQSGGEGESNVPSLSEKEAHGESGREKIEGKYKEILSKVSSKGAATKPTAVLDVDLDAKSISTTVDEESKIQKLLDLASAKGVAHAVKVARTLDDYYALDQMHDALADKLYQGLLAQGLIQKD